MVRESENLLNAAAAQNVFRTVEKLEEALVVKVIFFGFGRNCAFEAARTIWATKSYCMPSTCFEYLDSTCYCTRVRNSRAGRIDKWWHRDVWKCASNCLGHLFPQSCGVTTKWLVIIPYILPAVHSYYRGCVGPAEVGSHTDLSDVGWHGEPVCAGSVRAYLSVYEWFLAHTRNGTFKRTYVWQKSARVVAALVDFVVTPATDSLSPYGRMKKVTNDSAKLITRAAKCNTWQDIFFAR